VGRPASRPTVVSGRDNLVPPALEPTGVSQCFLLDTGRMSERSLENGPFGVEGVATAVD
jgi:hypothetical protein